MAEQGKRKNSSYLPSVDERDDASQNGKRLAYLIRKKSYSSTLNMIKGDMAEGKKEITFEIEYVDSINGMIKEGKEELRKGNYANSGNIFSTLIALYPETESMRRGIGEKPEKIKKYIAISSEKLMESGLSEYREGNLGNAIKIWRKIMRFNPGFVQARNAIETATVQLKTLKSLGKNGN